MKNKNKEMNVAFTCDDAYLKYVSVTMVSVLINNPEFNVHFYIICNGVSEKSKQGFDLLKRQYACDITFLSVNTEMFSGITKNSSAHVSDETNYRYFIADLIPNIDKLLFLDGDLVVDGFIGDLYDTDLTDYYVAVAKDPLDRKEIASSRWWFEEFNIPQEYPYLNTGVFLVNMKKWRENNLGTKFIETARHWGSKFLFPDQDAINVVCYDKNYLLDQKYNFCCELLWDNLDDRKKAEQNAVVYHWAGGIKPWKKPMCKYGNVFWKYAAQSPFFVDIFYTLLSGYMSQAKSIVLDSLQIKKLKTQYHKYRLLSKCTFGAMKERYVIKKKEYRHRIHVVKKFIEGDIK